MSSDYNLFSYQYIICESRIFKQTGVEGGHVNSA